MAPRQPDGDLGFSVSSFMADEFLSINIPTRNRSSLLRDLLTSIAAELRTSGLTPEDVRVLVSDNCSTDNTREVAHEVMGGLPHFVYHCNEQNIGGDGNIVACAGRGAGQYKWLIGDDELLPAGSLAYVIRALREHKPGWFIHFCGDQHPMLTTSGLKPPRTFPSVAEFMRVAAAQAPACLMTAGTIPLNTFRADCFDHELARQYLARKSSYSQLFGLVNGMRKTGASVYVTERNTIHIREQRPAPSDGQLPNNSDANWKLCLTWIKETFNLPDLDPDIQSKLTSRDAFGQFLRHPVRTFRNYAPLFLIPGTYPRIVKRLWYAVKP